MQYLQKSGCIICYVSFNLNMPVLIRENTSNFWVVFEYSSVRRISRHLARRKNLSETRFADCSFAESNELNMTALIWGSVENSLQTILEIPSQRLSLRELSTVWKSASTNASEVWRQHRMCDVKNIRSCILRPVVWDFKIEKSIFIIMFLR